MALKALFLRGWDDGEHLLDTAGTDFVAGQPAKIVSTGLLQLATLPQDVLGLFKNDKADEVVGGPSAGDAPAAGFVKATVLKGSNKVEMSAGTLPNGSPQTPFLFPPTNNPWTPGQHLFLTGAGFWDNAPAAGNDPPFGTVLKAPASATDTLEADMYSMSGLFDSSLTT